MTPEGEAGPRHDPGDEAEPVAQHRRDHGERQDDQVEEVHPSLLSRRAWVRKPVWATMRWSGRTDWPSTCQPRCSTSIVSTMPNARRGQLLVQARHLADRREVREQDAAGRERGGRRA